MSAATNGDVNARHDLGIGISEGIAGNFFIEQGNTG